MKWATTGIIIGIIIFILNIFDGVATIILVNRGATELNPIIQWLMDRMGVWFLVPKIIISVPLVILIDYAWSITWVRIAGWATLALYSLIAINHVVGFILIFGG